MHPTLCSIVPQCTCVWSLVEPEVAIQEDGPLSVQQHIAEEEEDLWLRLPPTSVLEQPESPPLLGAPGVLPLVLMAALVAHCNGWSHR